MAGPETANNAATAGGFVPLLTLGIPTNSVLALMLAALMLHGVTPGPLLLFKWPDVFWGVIASMYIGNVMLLVLNLPMIGLFVQILKVPYGILSPLIIMFVMLGAYGLKNSVTDVLATLVFGVAGYLMKRYRPGARTPGSGLRLGPDAGKQPQQGPYHVPSESGCSSSRGRSRQPC